MRAWGRRTWLAAAAALAALPPAVLAQAVPRAHRVGILRAQTPDSVRVWDGFFEDLRRFGYLEGVNLVIELREFENVTTDPAKLAAELVRLRVDLIVTGSTPAAEAAKRATSTIPIVMTSHPDPVEAGLAVSLARPGGNVTGLSLITRELRAKQLELLKEIVPGLDRVAVLMIRDLPISERELRQIEGAARSMNVEVVPVAARSAAEIEGAVAAATKERAGGMIVLSGAMFYVNRNALAEYALRGRIPAIYAAREFAEAGGLISYGPSLYESYRRAAWYVDRVLKGARPQDLAIEQPTQFQLVVNMRAAKGLGLVIPPSLLARADRID